MGPVISRLSTVRPVNELRRRYWNWRRIHPPHVPRGWTTGPPTFVGVGAQKAGTTWWYRLITEHPAVVSRGHPKELHYFDALADRFDQTAADRYGLWFPRPPGAITGEWTPRYMSDEHAPRQLAAAAPEARVLVLLRDPVDRYVSGLTMQIARGWWNNESGAVSRGLYVRQLERIYDVFSPDQVLVLQYERCAADPSTEITRTYRFLGLDPEFVPRRPTRGINVGGPPVAVGRDRIRELVALYEPGVAELAALGVDIDLQLWPHFRHLGA